MMNSPDIANTVPVAYETLARPALRKPSAAAIGFFVFSLYFLASPTLFLLQRYAHIPNVPLLYTLLDIAFTAPLLVGAALVVHAFGGSSTMPPLLRATLLAAICSYGMFYILFTWVDGFPGTLPYPLHRWAGAIHLALTTAMDLCFFCFTLLWLVLLWRIARVLHSRPMRIAALLLLAFHAAFVGTWALVDADSMFRKLDLLHAVTPFMLQPPLLSVLFYANYLIPIPVFALSLWYARSVRRLAHAAPSAIPQ